MEIRQRAKARVIFEILSEPILLSFRFGGIADLEVDLAVERDNVPPAEVITVVAPARWTGSRTEVLEIRRAAPAVVIVIARRRVNETYDTRRAP